MESISKSRIQGVWDPAHSTWIGIIAHSTRVGIPSGCRHIPPGKEFHPATAITSGILLPPPLHPDVSHLEFCCRCHSIRLSYIRNSEAGWERGSFNFSRYTYPDPLIALTRRVSQPFCTVPLCSPEASRYVRPTSLDIFL